MPIYNCDTWEGSTITVSGRVSDLRYRNERLQIILKSVIVSDDALNPTDKQNIGVICYADKDILRPRLGSIISIKGTCYSLGQATNPGQFDMARYYQIKGIHFSIVNAQITGEGKNYDHFREGLYVVRGHLEEVYDRFFTDEEASILKAMTLGDKDYLTDDINRLFRNSGASHLLVISGTHIGILGVLFYELFKRLFRSWKIATIPTIMMIVVYGMMTGLGSATLRAVIMFAIRLIGQMLGRAYDVLTAILVAAVIGLIFNPLLIYDAGFLLSFGAVLGLALFGPATKSFSINMILKSLAPSISVTLITLPISLYFFYQYPVYSIFLNLILIPLAGVILILALSCSMIGQISLFTPFIKMAAVLLKLIIFVYIKGCEVSLRISGNVIVSGRPALYKIILYYLILSLALIFKKRILKLAMIVMVVLLFAGNRDGFSINMLDVGQGLCVAVTDEKHCVLYDCGSTDESDIAKYKVIPFMKYKGISKIDAIVISHTDSDHINGVKELMRLSEGENLKIGAIFMTEVSLNSDEGEMISKQASMMDIKVCRIKRGDSFMVSEMYFNCLHPKAEDTGDINELSAIFELEYKGISMMLSGDAEGIGEREIIDNGKNYTIFQVAHHGSKGTNSMEALRVIRPQISLISCGKGNTYGHPHRETIDRLNEVNSLIYTTMEDGEITVLVKKNKIVLKPYLRRD